MLGQVEHIMKIVEDIKDWGFFLKNVNETITNETKEQKGGILGILLCNFDASLVENKFVMVKLVEVKE